jgi:hypothetical protein
LHYSYEKKKSEIYTQGISEGNIGNVRYGLLGINYEIMLDLEDYYLLGYNAV